MTITKTAAPCKACASMIYRGIGHTCPKPDCYYHVPVAAPKRATGGELREVVAQLVTLLEEVDGSQRFKDCAAAFLGGHGTQILAALTNPAIAPGGDDTKLLADCYIAMRDAMNVIDPEEGPGRQHSRVLTALADCRVRIENRRAVLPAAGNAGAVDDAMIERALKASFEYLQIGNLKIEPAELRKRNAVRAMLTAALSGHAAQEDGARAATPAEEADIDAAAELTKLTFRMPDDLLGAVDAQAAQEGLIRVAMIRTLIKRGLSSENVAAPSNQPAASQPVMTDGSWKVPADQPAADSAPFAIVDGQAFDGPQDLCLAYSDLRQRNAQLTATCDELLIDLRAADTRDGRDAVRYRWLRENNHLNRHDIRQVPYAVISVYGKVGRHQVRHMPGEKLDAAIDAAMKEQAHGVE